MKEKQYISTVIENLLLSLNHPEMPKEKPNFTLHIDGKESWSWADIKPNWTFGIDNPPKINLFNELAAMGLLKDEEKEGGEV